MKNILLAGGGTAGHVVPHLALMPFFEKNFDNVYHIGASNQIEKRLFSTTCAQLFKVETPPLKRSLSIQNLTIPFKLFKAIKECEKIIDKVKPCVIFSKGGYCALPVCIAGFNRQIPVVCHESDISLGLANKLVLRRSKAILTTFEETLKDNPKRIYAGPIIRQSFFNKDKQECKRKIGITNSKPVLLVTGGSQGSKAINQAIEKNLSFLTSNFNVIHLLGNNNKPPYSTINGYFPFEFYDTSICVNACDICISRGGSNTLFELLATTTPSLIIPLTKGSRGDQIKNAKYFYEKGALLYATEENLDENLPNLVTKLYKERKLLTLNAKKLNLERGADTVLNVILKYAK